MVKPSSRDVVERFVRAIENKDFDALEALIADDYVDEMPQSGERIRGKANQLALVRTYPGGVGTVAPGSTRLVGSEDRWIMTPSFSILRIEGSGDVYTYAGTIRYANSETWHVVAIVELRGGKVARTTTYYAAPFEAPEWRKHLVERFSPLGA